MLKEVNCTAELQSSKGNLVVCQEVLRSHTQCSTPEATFQQLLYEARLSILLTERWLCGTGTCSSFRRDQNSLPSYTVPPLVREGAQGQGQACLTWSLEEALRKQRLNL